MQTRAQLLKDPAALEALANPIRRQILQVLREPDSAASVARQIELPRQKVNYHVQALARLKLLRPAGERRKGHLIEKLFETVAGTFVPSVHAVWDDDARTQALRDQVSLNHLVNLGERLQQDATGLLDRAAFEGEEISSASVEAEIRFATEEDRGAFMQEYLQLLGPLLERYGAKEGRTYRIATAAYPDPEED